MDTVCVFINCSNLVRRSVSSLSSVVMPGIKRGSETAAGVSYCFISVSPSASCTLSCTTQQNVKFITQFYTTHRNRTLPKSALNSPVRPPSWELRAPCPSGTLSSVSANCSRHKLSVILRTRLKATSCPRLFHCRFRSVRNRQRPSYGIFAVREHGRLRWPHRLRRQRLSGKRSTFWYKFHTQH